MATKSSSGKSETKKTSSAKSTQTKTSSTKKPTQSKSSAPKKSEQTQKSTSTNRKSSNSGSGLRFWGINKIAFYTVCAVAIIYLVSAILGACKVQLKVINALQGLATAMLIVLASCLAWRYVAKKQTVWKVLYIVCLLVVVLGIILPLVA